MSVAVCSLGCDRKMNDIHSWSHLMKLQGDYTLYLNYETGRRFDIDIVTFIKKYRHDLFEYIPGRSSLDVWGWDTEAGMNWRKRPKFDQDQARLSSIVTARNMCVEYAIQTDSTHLLFIDADIIPPDDIIPKLLDACHTSKDRRPAEHAAGGLVNGRGVHSHQPYLQGEKGRRTYYKTDHTGNVCDEFDLIEAEYANIGFCMIPRRLFEAVRFRYGMTTMPDGSRRMLSDDPCFHLDCFNKFGEWMFVRPDVVGKHVGDLKAEHVGQF